MGWATRERSQGSSASEFHLQGVGRATSPLQPLPLAPSKLWTSWLNSCLLGLGRGLRVLWVPRFHRGCQASRWWGGEEPTKSLPGSRPPARRWGARPYWVPSPDLVLWEGDLAWVYIPSSRGGSLSGVLPNVLCLLSGPMPGLALSRHFRLFSPKVQEMGKKNDFVYLLSVAFWTLIPEQLIGGQEEGCGICFRHPRQRRGWGP